MMLAIEASETSAKNKNRPQPNSLKKVFNKNSDSGCECLRQFINLNIHAYNSRLLKNMKNYFLALKVFDLLCF